MRISRVNRMFNNKERITMKFLPLFLLSLLVVTPACVRKKKVENKQTIAASDAEGYVKSGKQSIFDEDVEAFVLVDEGSDPFKMPASRETVELMMINDDKLQDDYFIQRAEQRSKYGLKAIYFDFNKNEVRKDQEPALKHDLKKIKEIIKQGHEVIIEGHACNWAGEEAFNMMLSERRAQSVYDYLVKHGIAADKLKVVGFGFSMCVVPFGDKTEQAPNRRVEFFIK